MRCLMFLPKPNPSNVVMLCKSFCNSFKLTADFFQYRKWIQKQSGLLVYTNRFLSPLTCNQALSRLRVCKLRRAAVKIPRPVHKHWLWICVSYRICAHPALTYCMRYHVITSLCYPRASSAQCSFASGNEGALFFWSSCPDVNISMSRDKFCLRCWRRAQGLLRHLADITLSEVVWRAYFPGMRVSRIQNMS